MFPLAALTLALAPLPTPRAVAARQPALRAATQPRMLGTTETAAALLASTGALAWVSPEANLPGFDGYADDEPAQRIVQTVGAWQICFAYVLLAGKQGAAIAAGQGLYAASVTTLAIIPVWSQLGREKYSQAGAAVLFACLGKLTFARAISPFVAAAAYLLTGGLIFCTPRATAGLYQLTTPLSELASSMLGLYGGVIAMGGVYLAALAAGLTQPRCLAAVLLANGFIALKWTAMEASKLKQPKWPAAAWAAVSAALAALAIR